MRDLVGDFWFDTRRAAKPTFVLVVAACLIFFVVGGSIVGLFYFFSDKVKPPQATSSRIPVTAYTAGMVQVFGCLAHPDGCPKYGKARKYMTTITPAGLTYRPLSAPAPGSPTDHGMRHVVLPELSKKELVQVAQAVTLHGAANTDTVTGRTVTVHQNMGTFTVTSERGGTYRVTMVFNRGDSGTTLRSVTYEVK